MQTEKVIAGRYVTIENLTYYYFEFTNHSYIYFIINLN